MPLRRERLSSILLEPSSIPGMRWEWRSTFKSGPLSCFSCFLKKGKIIFYILHNSCSHLYSVSHYILLWIFPVLSSSIQLLQLIIYKSNNIQIFIISGDRRSEWIVFTFRWSNIGKIWSIEDLWNISITKLLFWEFHCSVM